MSDPLSDAVVSALRSYRTQGLQYDDNGGGAALADVFSGKGADSIEGGLREIEILADELCVAIEAAGLSPAPYHYTADGDYPSDTRNVLVFRTDRDEEPIIGCLDFGEDPTVWCVFTTLGDEDLPLSSVYAWQELPSRAPRRGEG